MFGKTLANADALMVSRNMPGVARAIAARARVPASARGSTTAASAVMAKSETAKSASGWAKTTAPTRRSAIVAAAQMATPRRA